MLPVKEVAGFFRELPADPHPFVLFLSDQAPAEPRRAWWTDFLNQDTAVYLGPELLARRYDLPVVWVHFRRVSRGRYRAEMIDIAAHAGETPLGEITEKHVRILEDLIRRHPEQWLWSHRRWKHKRPEKARGKPPSSPAEAATT
jgi:KDO2-lipid IV(A) lauroyltransferase